MNKKTIFGIFAVLVVGIILATTTVMAYREDSTIKGPNYTEERHELMQKAFADNDFDTWKLLMEENSHKGRVLDVVTKENFATFVELHEANLAGDLDKVSELRSELGLNGMGKRGQGKGQGSQAKGFGCQR